MDDPGRSRNRLRSEINIAPLVDVCLVLLIIFMVVTPMLLSPHGVELPKGDDPPDEPGKIGIVRISIAYGPPPAIYLGRAKEPISVESLKSELKELRASAATIRLLIHADHRLSYRSVKDVLGTLDESGFSTASLIAERLPRAKTRD